MRRAMNKENKGKSQIKLGVILGYINMALGTLIPFFYTQKMLEILGQSEYGLYNLAASATSYVSLVAFGVGGAVSRYLIKARTEEGKEAEERIFGLFNTFFAVIAALAGIIGVIIAFNFEGIYDEALTPDQIEKMRVLILLITANMVIGFASSSYNAVVSSHERFLFIQLANIITTVCIPIANLVALYLGYASIGMAVVSILGSVISRVAFFLYVRKNIGLKPRYGKISFGIVREVLTFSFWIFVGNLVNQLYQQTDTMIIGAVPHLGTDAVAVYKIGTVFSGMMMNFTLIVSTTLTPKVNKMVFAKESEEGMTDFASRVGRLQAALVFLVCSGFIVFGRPFIEWYTDSSYWEAFWVAVVIMIPSCVPLTQSVCLSMTVAKNKHRFRAIVYLIIAIINVVGTYLLVNRFGIIGAAVMTGVANIIGQGFVMNWFYHNKMGINIFKFWKEILKTLWIPALMCAVTLVIANFVDFYNKTILVAGIGIYTVIYAVLWWFFTANESEKDIILGVFRKFSKNKK